MDKNLKHRVAQGNKAVPITALDRSRRLKSFNVTLGKLKGHETELLSMEKTVIKDLGSVRREIIAFEKKIKELTPEDGIVVTEHALLRYVERFMGIDLNDVHERIINLPEKDKVMGNNTVITVYPDSEDHFNLAENEKSA